MALKHSILAICVLSLISAKAVAQAKDSTINRNVTVERDYVPVIKNSGKIISTPDITLPQKTRLDAIYSTFSIPLPLSQNIEKLPAAISRYKSDSDKRRGYARLGLGTYPNALAEVMYPIVQTSDLRLDGVFTHRGAYNSKLHTATHANLFFDKYFSSFTLFGGIDGGHEGVKFYGKNFDEENKIIDFQELLQFFSLINYKETNTFAHRQARTFLLNDLAAQNEYANYWRLGANAGFRSAEDAENWRYLGQVKYNLFHNTVGVSEQIIHTQGQLNFIFSDDRLGADIDLYNAFYSNSLTDSVNFWKNYAVFKLAPYYELNRYDNFKLRLGLSAALPMANKTQFHLSPDVRAEWNTAPDFFALYAGLTGDYAINSMNKTFTENPYLAPDVRVQDTYTPLDFYFGFKLKPMYGLLLDAFADYVTIDNQYFFVSREYENVNQRDHKLFSNRFDVLYDGGTLFKTGARVSYYYLDKVNVELKGAYNAWNLKTEKYAWNKPQYEVDFNVNIRAAKDVNITLTGYYQDGIFAKINNKAIEMKPRIDLNLGGSYTYLDWLTFFANVNNLLNSRYDVFYDYDVQGINVMLGATVSF